jgi:hypothetical protein
MSKQHIHTLSRGSGVTVKPCDLQYASHVARSVGVSNLQTDTSGYRVFLLTNYIAYW